MPTQPTLITITRAVVLAGLCTLAVACSPTATTAPPTAAPANAAPTVAPAAPVATTAPAAQTTAPTAASVPTATARGTQTAASAASQATPGQAQPVSPAQTATAASASDAVHLTLDPASSSASYHAREQLVGRSLPSDAVGTSPGVSGALVLGADGSVVADQSTITVDLTKLKSDESRRDNFIQGNTLQTSRFPTATFTPRSVQGLSMPLPTSGQATFQLLGDLTVHGVTKPATWQVTAQFADTSVTGNATTSVNLTDFGMTPPKAGPVLSIEDGLTLELAFTANRGA
jgi:polyisoprenoid-binding protein YceI